VATVSQSIGRRHERVIARTPDRTTPPWVAHAESTNASATASIKAADGVAATLATVIGLAGLIAPLLAVGVESGTPIRHVVQVSAAGLALLLSGLGSPIGRAAALPVLTVWLGVMGAIWLHLLGVASIIRGRFTTTEIALTIAIAAACAVGLVGGPRPTAGLSAGRRFAVGIVFAAAQLLALWASMQPAVVMRRPDRLIRWRRRLIPRCYTRGPC
jgi:hypothetical protein